VKTVKTILLIPDPPSAVVSTPVVVMEFCVWVKTFPTALEIVCDGEIAIVHR